jgi:hypothetical protein
MDTTNLYHKLHPSVKHLATGKGSIQRRLEEIFVTHLLSLALEESKAELLVTKAIQMATSKEPQLKTIGKLHYTLSTNHWRQNLKISELIFEAYESIAPLYHRDE